MPLPSPEPLITLQGASLTADGRAILHPVDLTLRRGDFMAITGPNGGGKTSLLRLMLRLAPPSAGRVVYSRPHITTGYLPQKSRIDAGFPLSVTDVVTGGLYCRPAITAAERPALIASTLELLDLTGHASAPIATLSGGQLQRALLGRAIISRPELLVLDEPLSYLDAVFIPRMAEILHSFSSAGATIVMVSHHMNQIAAEATVRLTVSAGKVTF